MAYLALELTANVEGL